MLARRNPQTHARRPSFQVSSGVIASRLLSHRWLKACRGRWSLLCNPLIRIIKLSQPAAHKWGILPAPPSCRDSLQIASDSPPDCAMIMLSLDAVIMMAHNCWCALAAAQHPPDLSVYLSVCLYRPISPPLQFLSFLQLFSRAHSVVFKLTLSRPPWDSTLAPEKMEFAHIQRLPRTSGLFNNLDNVCVGSWWWWWGWFTRCTNTHACMRTTCLLMAQNSHFHEWHHVTCGKPAECVSSWRREAICLGGKTEECLFGLVGLTVSPVKAMLQLSAFEQMGTNLHLINPTSPPSSSWRILLSFPSSPSSLNSLAGSCHVTVWIQVH